MAQQFHGNPRHGTPVPELPKLQLPTFSLRSAPSRESSIEPPPRAPRQSSAPLHRAPSHATPERAPVQATALRMAHHAPLPIPAQPAPIPVAQPQPLVQQPIHAQPTAVAWNSPSATMTQDTWLNRVTPVHMGIAMTLFVFVMIVANGSPGGIRKSAPAALPVPASVTPASSQTLPLRRKSSQQGMMSPAAAEAILARREGRSPRRAAERRVAGMPSPAAAQSLQGETLPMKRHDLMTIPPPGGGDAHAVDSHYRPQTLAMAKPIERPALTPGESAAQAQSYGNVASTVNPGTAPADPNGAF